jgi:glycosyltransferase involved in cell wall biosynthesis
MMTARNPKVSVLIPTYNYANYIGHAIQSIIDQSFADWELIISDDCSTDNTIEIVQQYIDPRIRFIVNDKNLGLYGNFNHCGKIARGQYLLFLGADDALHYQALEHMVSALDNHGTAALATAYQVQFIDGEGENIGGVFYKKLGPGLIKGHMVLMAQCHFPMPVGSPSHVMIRSSCLSPGEIFDRSVEHCADNDLWCKLCEKWDVVYVAKALVYQREHQNQATKTHHQQLLDIQHGHDMFVRLFTNSSFCLNNLWLKHVFVKNRLYFWFKRAFREAQNGEWNRCFFILSKISSFSKFPWWIPYFTLIKINDKLKFISPNYK